MKKIDAIKLFGKRQIDLARGVDLTKGAISQWDDELDERTTRYVLGSALRKRIPIPEQLLDD